MRCFNLPWAIPQTISNFTNPISSLDPCILIFLLSEYNFIVILLLLSYSVNWYQRSYVPIPQLSWLPSPFLHHFPPLRGKKKKRKSPSCHHHQSTAPPNSPSLTTNTNCHHPSIASWNHQAKQSKPASHRLLDHQIQLPLPSNDIVIKLLSRQPSNSATIKSKY